MNKTVIAVKDGVINVVVKNLCSFSYDKKIDQFVFTSANTNINVTNTTSYYKFKSFGFRYGGEREESEDPFEFKTKPSFVFVIHKSFNNGYNIKKGTYGGKFENFTYLTVPSKIFKKLRYAIYELNGISKFYGPLIAFRYQKNIYDLTFESSTKKLMFRKTSFGDCSNTLVKDYISLQNYATIILENGEEYIFSTLFNKSRSYKNKHFIRYIPDLTLRFDILEYILSKPESLIISDKEEVININTESCEF